jgi:hypothetical protein
MSDFQIPEGLGGPGPMLDFKRDWCARHLEPYRGERPKGAPIAMVLLFDAFAQDERVHRMAGFDPEVEGSVADSTRLPALVAECSPLCCFLGDEIVEEIRVEAFAGDGPRCAAIRDRRAA